MALPIPLEGIKTTIESSNDDDYEKVMKQIIGHWLRQEVEKEYLKSSNVIENEKEAPPGAF